MCISKIRRYNVSFYRFEFFEPGKLLRSKIARVLVRLDHEILDLVSPEPKEEFLKRCTEEIKYWLEYDEGAGHYGYGKIWEDEIDKPGVKLVAVVSNFDEYNKKVLEQFRSSGLEVDLDEIIKAKITEVA